MLLRFELPEDIQLWINTISDVQERMLSFAAEANASCNELVHLRGAYELEGSSCAMGCGGVPLKGTAAGKASRLSSKAERPTGETLREYGSFATSRGETYAGGVRLLQKHGYGSLVKACGDKVTGWWEHDQLEGVGEYVSVSGSWVYHGGFRCGKRAGAGVITLASGDRWDCQWKDDAVLAGTGTQIRGDGEMYTGGCIPSSACNCSELLPPGTCHCHLTPMRNGHGKLRLTGGEQLEGYFCEGVLLDGSKAVLRYRDGALYFGQFRGEAPHGYGELYLSEDHPMDSSSSSCTARHQEASTTSNTPRAGLAGAWSELGQDILWYKGPFEEGLPHGTGLVRFRDRVESTGVSTTGGSGSAGHSSPLACQREEIRRQQPVAKAGTARGVGVGAGVGVMFMTPMEDDEDEEEEDDDEADVEEDADAANDGEDTDLTWLCEYGNMEDYEATFVKGVLQRHDPSNLRLAALRYARAEVRRLHWWEQQQHKALYQLRAQELCLLCNKNEMNALLLQCQHMPVSDEPSPWLADPKFPCGALHSRSLPPSFVGLHAVRREEWGGDGVPIVPHQREGSEGLRNVNLRELRK
ncbi:unnamed protein product [Chrysoparadoxa australica]